MRIVRTYLHTRFIAPSDEPSKLTIELIGKRDDLQKLLQTVETECGKPRINM